MLIASKTYLDISSHLIETRGKADFGKPMFVFSFC